eukprot:889431-Rhodomonas_salina.1
MTVVKRYNTLHQYHGQTWRVGEDEGRSVTCKLLKGRSVLRRFGQPLHAGTCAMSVRTSRSRRVARQAD